MSSPQLRDAKLEPYWWEGAPRRERPAEDMPARSDLVIVGSGYSGLSAALTGAGAGASVTVLEADRLGEGASTRNGGAVGETLRISFARMEKEFGRERAIAYYKEIRAARDHLEKLINDHAIECAYRRVGRFIGAHKPQDYESLARDLDARKRAIGFDAEMIPQGEVRRIVGSDVYCGGRLIHSDGNLHPGLYHEGILRAAAGAGATIVERNRVLGFSPEGDGFKVRTERGDILAGKLIIATNGYTGSLSPWLARRIIPIQSQIIVTEPLPKAKVEELIPMQRQMGDTRKLHNYFRTSPDGTRILFGGRAGATEFADERKRADHLRRQMVDVFPDLDAVRITHAWAGLIAYTFDSLPHMATHEGVHFVGGCCGSGVALQPWLGHKAALKALGRDGSQTVFDQQHPGFPGYFGRPWFMPAVIALFAWRDRLKI